MHLDGDAREHFWVERGDCLQRDVPQPPVRVLELKDKPRRARPIDCIGHQLERLERHAAHAPLPVPQEFDDRWHLSLQDCLPARVDEQA